MGFHKYGFGTMVFSTMAFALFNLGMWRMFYKTPFVYQLLFFITLALLVLVFLHFRTRNATTAKNNNVLVSPVDGTITSITDNAKNNIFQGDRTKVSIKLSPFGMHAFYAPLSGDVELYKNEGKSSVLIQNSSNQTLLLTQNAVSLSSDQEIDQGENIGFLALNSQVDLYLPENVDLSVKLGEKVRANSTILANMVQ